ncbi:hypothetical protein B0T11DRAFT_65020 [Plectosphaerella cucumerina]|uniref:Uncharacterized protein n=1 Tax=Plectosphaerella cucumerina TaxID=40658 RepID=A0A8K0TJ81_9PEZI|nr:hypothetical protein B0T11DRAFT_65020 [Plectosphaerella cucumerina]
MHWSSVHHTGSATALLYRLFLVNANSWEWRNRHCCHAKLAILGARRRLSRTGSVQIRIPTGRRSPFAFCPPAQRRNQLTVFADIIFSCDGIVSGWDLPRQVELTDDRLALARLPCSRTASALTAHGKQTRPNIETSKHHPLRVLSSSSPMTRMIRSRSKALWRTTIRCQGPEATSSRASFASRLSP